MAVHFIKSMVPVSSAVRELPAERVYTVEVWQRPRNEGTNTLDLGKARECINTWKTKANTGIDAVKKLASGMNLSPSQWNGKNPEFVFRVTGWKY